MGSPLFDAVMKRFRRDLVDKVEAGRRPAVTAPPGLRGRGFDFSAQPVYEDPGSFKTAAWEAFKVYHDTGLVMKVDNIEFIRPVDQLTSGRLVAVWVGLDQTAFAFHFNLQFSDNNGETWSALSSLNVSTTTPPLGRNGNRFGGVVAWDGKAMVFVRGLVATGGDPPARKIYRAVWDGSWGAPSLWYSRAGWTVLRPRPGRSRDRSVGGIVFEEQEQVEPFNTETQYIPFTASGDPGTKELIHATGGFAQTALVFTADNFPKFVGISGTTIFRKTRTASGWPASFDTFTVDDPPTDPDILAVLTPGFNLLTWGGGALTASGDVHGLKKVNGNENRDFQYRSRVDGTWAEETIDFGALDTPMAGDGSEWYGSEHFLGVLTSAAQDAYGLIWMTETSFAFPFTLWWVRRESENA